MDTRTLLLGLLCCGVLAPTASAEPAPALLDELARRYSTPQAVAEFLTREFRFVRDRDQFGVPDRWQSPEEFLARRAGDCEDYAMLARELLRRNGVDAAVFSLFGDDGYAHTVCVFRDNRGRYSAITTGGLRWLRVKSLTALATRVHPAWTFGGIVEPDGARGRLVRRLDNPDPVSIIGADPFAF